MDTRRDVVDDMAAAQIRLGACLIGGSMLGLRLWARMYPKSARAVADTPWAPVYTYLREQPGRCVVFAVAPPLGHCGITYARDEFLRDYT